MARTLTTATKDESKLGHVTPVIFVELDFSPSGIQRLHSQVGTLTFGGNSYSGVGDFGGVTAISEPSDLSSPGVSFKLTGIPTSMVNIALQEKYQGRLAKVWLGFLNSSGVVIADPSGPYVFRMDVMDIKLGKNATITLNAESPGIIWSRASIRRYTNADQTNEFPGDKFFEFISEMAEKEIIWPGIPDAVASQVTNPGGAVDNEGFPNEAGGTADLDDISGIIGDPDDDAP